MAERRLTVLIALSDAERAEDLAHALAEEDGITVATPSELEQPEDFDVAVTDGDIIDGATPHIVLGSGAAAANVHAVLPALSGANLVGAAVRIAAAGYRMLPAETANADFHAAGPQQPNGNLHLTSRELETLALLSDGASNKVIARQLDISVHTAKFHVASVLAKLHAQNRADAVAIGLRQGLLYL
jgi:DNA-binding CsgD family transcriptional regulator